MYGSVEPEKYFGTHRLMRHFCVGLELIGPIGNVRVTDLLKGFWPHRINETYWPRWQWRSQDTCRTCGIYF